MERSATSARSCLAKLLEKCQHAQRRLVKRADSVGMSKPCRLQVISAVSCRFSILYICLLRNGHTIKKFLTRRIKGEKHSPCADDQELRDLQIDMQLTTN